MGCRNCYSVFFNKKEIIKLTGVSDYPHLREKKLPNCDLIFSIIDQGISVRVRIARNFKNRFFGSNQIELLAFMDRFLQFPECKAFESYGKVHAFDEDHIRAEYFLGYGFQKLINFPTIFYNKDIFEYNHTYGYLTKCPTNSGRGNKISFKVPLGKFSKKISISELENKYRKFISFKDSSYIILFIKNFNKNRLRNFTYFIWNVVLGNSINP